MTKLKLLKEVYVPTEAEITHSIRTYLNMKGIFHFKHWAGMGSYKGVSDILGILPGDGRFLAIEVKKPGGTPTPNQKKFIDDINKDGGVAFVARSVEEVITRLQIKNPLV